MNLYRVESQLTSLERLVPHLMQHGCDISAQDAAQSLMRYFDDLRPAGEDKALASACYREHMLRAEAAAKRLDG